MEKLLLIDANALIHRSFHALPPLTTKKGEPAGALYGLSNTLLKILRDERPDYVMAAFDTPHETFRKKEYKEYKAHRPKAPDELTFQIIKAHELFEKFGIPTLEKPGFEADDILGTFAEKFGGRKNLNVVILTGDLDTLQLVKENKVVVLTPKKGVSEMIRYNEERVKERFGILPKQLPDYKGLVGDPSDNIPGVPGVGPKTASAVLNKHQTLEKVYKNLKVKDASTKKIFENKKQAFLSKKLAIIDKNVPLKISLGELKYKSGTSKELISFFRELNFDRLLKRLGGDDAVETPREKDAGEAPSAVFVERIDSYLKKPPKFLKSDQLKVARDWKPFIKELGRNGVDVKEPFFDLKIAAWLLNPERENKELDKIIREKPAQELFVYLYKKLKEHGLENVFYNIEMPLIKVLSEMEERGIGIDEKALGNLKNEINRELDDLTQKIHKKAGMNFNINSPRQVGQVLFETLKIKGKRAKTATGQYKTSEKALKDLKSEHPIIGLILKYRELFKVKSTYVEPLLEVGQKTRGLFDSAGKKRVHTTFLQTATATGRLASENPNLQNVPKGTKWATLLRNAFRAEEGWSFLSFDYSQLELRLLAHVSGDPKLTKAFKEGKDVHRLTASNVFNVPLEKVGAKERGFAKTLNFGVIYGMGARAFSETSGLSLQESKKFIEEYFKDFPKVKKWQEETINEARARGYVSNLNGRRRLFFGEPQMERAVINMPLQSLGADIIKLAMIKTFNALKKEGGLRGGARMILSIHDELLLEVSNDILKEIVLLVREILENKTYKLSVPLTVEVSKGTKWGEMKTI